MELFSSDMKNAEVVASFSHKFAMASVLKHCDEFPGSEYSGCSGK